MTYPGKRWCEDSVGHFLRGTDADQDTKEQDLNPSSKTEKQALIWGGSSTGEGERFWRISV